MKSKRAVRATLHDLRDLASVKLATVPMAAELSSFASQPNPEEVNTIVPGTNVRKADQTAHK